MAERDWGTVFKCRLRLIER